MDDRATVRRTATVARVSPRAAAAGLALLTLCATGCMTSKVDETRQVATAIQANESIVLLKKPQLEGVGTEEGFLDCVQERLGGQLVHPEDGQSGRESTSRVPFKIYGEQEFTDAMFPWFEPSTAPANAAGLKVLLQRPGVTERLQQIGVRYVVWLDGNTRKTDGGGSVACAAGPGGAGCLGLGHARRPRDRPGHHGRHRDVGADRRDRADPHHHARAAQGLRPAQRTAALVPVRRRHGAGHGRRCGRCGGRCRQPALRNRRSRGASKPVGCCWGRRPRTRKRSP
jgi:hypothetical protein